MAFISQFDLFEQRPLQSCIESSFTLKLSPLQALNPLPQTIEFYSSAIPAAFLDVSRIKMRMVLKMKTRAGANLVAANNDCSTVCLMPDSMFSHLDILINEKSVVLHPENYNYKAILQHYTKSTEAAIGTHLACCLGQPDDNAGAVGGEAWTARQLPFLLSQPVEVMTKLRQDICGNQGGKYLLDNTSIRFRFELAPENFYLWSRVAPLNVRLDVQECQLILPYVRATSDLVLAIENSLLKSPAIYNYKSCQIKSYVSPAATRTISASNLYNGVLPSLLVFGLVRSTDMTGTATTSPYDFHHANVRQVSVFVNHEEYRFTCDFGQPQAAVEAYSSIATALGTDGCDQEHSCLLTLSRFRTGMAIYGLDLTCDNFGNAGPHTNLPAMGSVSINIELREDPAAPLTLIACAEFDSVLSIDHTRTPVVLA